MAKLSQADFYFGAAVSKLLNDEINPALVEGGTNRRVYEFTTNDGDFDLFMKYRSEASPTKDPDYKSWQFVFSTDEIRELNQYLSGQKHLSVGLICGTNSLPESEYAVLHKEEIQELLAAGKTSITISRKVREKAFRISVGGGRDNAMQIPTNRIY